MGQSCRLLDFYTPPEGFVLESLVATSYRVDFDFFEEELLAIALGVRSPVSRQKPFRSELERKLERAEVSVLYDIRGCDHARLSPRVDPIPISSANKLHSKISLLMWVREDRDEGKPPDRRLRLIVGSANLTRQGFRQNYECVACVDYDTKKAAPHFLLTKAIALIREIAADTKDPQLLRQLKGFETQATLLENSTPSADDPLALVGAKGVLAAIRDAWADTSNKKLERITLVSPFWVEGITAPEALVRIIRNLGEPVHLELICCGGNSADGKKWLPIFDGSLAVRLKEEIGCRVYLRAAKPNFVTKDAISPDVDGGDEMEDKELEARFAAIESNGNEVQRSLHAKIILLDGAAGSVLYAGSSNCTRRGLALDGLLNFEAGFVYKLSPRQRKQMANLFDFADNPIEVQPGILPATVQPPANEEGAFFPTFLSEIVAAGTNVTIRFRDAVPSDLVLLMPVARGLDQAGYFFLYEPNADRDPAIEEVAIDLARCLRCDDSLAPLLDPSSQQIVPQVCVEVRWEGHKAEFPVRFDDKTSLPLILVGRRPTEAELIDYFLFGKEPGDFDEVSGLIAQELIGVTKDAPIDTRGILAYFIRRFVQAIPGIEAEIRRASYSRVALSAVLTGPTSPLELAVRARASLNGNVSPGEPKKTPTAVGFQLVEILAALDRCRSRITDAEVRECFEPVMTKCRDLLETLVSEEGELQGAGFRHYQQKMLEVTP